MVLAHIVMWAWQRASEAASAPQAKSGCEGRQGKCVQAEGQWLSRWSEKDDLVFQYTCAVPHLDHVEIIPPAPDRRICAVVRVRP